MGRLSLTEREKYERMWEFPAYRGHSPGARAVASFLEIAKPAPGARVADCGCGTGRAGAKLAQAGIDAVLIDFADNCRDPVAHIQDLPFVRADLAASIPVRADYVFCADVMEHIPPEQVDAVLANLGACAPRLFLQISTRDDCCGTLIGETLHLSVHPHAWWREKLAALWRIEHEEERRSASTFYVMAP